MPMSLGTPFGKIEAGFVAVISLVTGVAGVVAMRWPSWWTLSGCLVVVAGAFTAAGMAYEEKRTHL